MACFNRLGQVSSSHSLRGHIMTNTKRVYLTPTLTEVKFEDKNLVSFLSCSKQTRAEGAVTNGCCELQPEKLPASAFDPS